MYFVGDRPRAWMSRDDDKEGKEAAGGAGKFAEEILDKITVKYWSSALRIRWDGELEPKFPE